MSLNNIYVAYNNHVVLTAVTDRVSLATRTPHEYERYIGDGTNCGEEKIQKIKTSTICDVGVNCTT
jgi:hypothetical protein